VWTRKHGEDKDSEQKCTGRREAVGLKKEEKEEEEEEEEEELGRWTGDESERLRRLAGGAELCCARLGADQQATFEVSRGCGNWVLPLCCIPRPCRAWYLSECVLTTPPVWRTLVQDCFSHCN
jgi:hypothetical protein